MYIKVFGLSFSLRPKMILVRVPFQENLGLKDLIIQIKIQDSLCSEINDNLLNCKFCHLVICLQCVGRGSVSYFIYRSMLIQK